MRGVQALVLVGVLGTTASTLPSGTPRCFHCTGRASGLPPIAKPLPHTKSAWLQLLWVSLSPVKETAWCQFFLQRGLKYFP